MLLIPCVLSIFLIRNVPTSVCSTYILYVTIRELGNNDVMTARQNNGVRTFNEC